MTDQRPARQMHQEHELYLLRVWHEPTDPVPAWRASLHLPHGAPRKYFATRAALIQFLLEEFSDGDARP